MAAGRPWRAGWPPTSTFHSPSSDWAWGRCLGFELTRWLRREGPALPNGLFVAGAPAPQGPARGRRRVPRRGGGTPAGGHSRATPPAARPPPRGPPAVCPGREPPSPCPETPTPLPPPPPPPRPPPSG